MRSRTLAATAVMATAAAAVAYAIATAPSAAAAASDPYTFKNVEIVGGGFVPGIVFNKTRQNLIYARTDIGGVYRWNPTTGRWIPLTDFISNADYNLLGVESLATDPVDPNRVYAAVGAYVQSFAGNGAILRSSDQGNTWARTNLPFKLGGNEPGRSIGERLQVDPNRNATLYFGTRNDGLWRSTDSGVTWARVTSFPVTGQANLGVGVVTFDKASGAAGSATPTIYVSVIDTATPIYRSTDAGATWSALPGQPAAGMPHHVELASDGTLYVTYGDAAGPYQMWGGQVWKRTSAGVWSNITPLLPYQNGEQGFGYAGLAVDPQNAQTVMVATMSRWGPVDDIFRTTNGGTTWTSITSRKVLDTSGSPFLNWHGTPKLGWMIGDVEIDPFNRNRFLYGTGATIFGGDDLLNADSATGQVHINVRAQGLEETAVQDIISPPSGPPLVSALGDIGVYRHDNINVAPPNGMAENPIYGTATSLDFAELAPAQMVSAGYGNATDRLASFSADGGTTWSMVASEPENPDGAGIVAMAADGSAALWSPAQRGVFYTTNRGATWTASTGISGAGISVRSDRVNPNNFYAFINGTFYVSTNKGASFAAAASGLPTGSTYFKAVPGREGDIWATTGYGGLYHSTNSGATFSQLTNVTEAYTVGFGLHAPNQTYPAVFLNGIVDGVSGVFRSDDAGVTWLRINDDAHQYGWIGKAITGDPRVYGRVYFSTNGRGIIYGDRTGSGTGDTSAPTTPGTPTASGLTATSVNLAWTASTDNVAVTGYDVVRVQGTTETTLASPTTNSASLAGLTPSTAYTFAVYARDASGNRSTRSGTVVVTTPAGADTTAPTAPGTPVTSAITSSGATLSWAASTDNVAVTGYDVLNASNAVVGTSATASVALTGLTATTQYVLRVRARDAAGNLSTPSGAVTFTTAASSDTTAPSVPGTPTASAVTATGATLTWTASTDTGGSGLAGYTIYRRVGTTDTQLATSTTNSVTLTGLAAATAYQIVVRARDGAGNLSATSAVGSFTTSTAPTGSGCTVTYSIAGQWAGAFQGEIKLTNNGATAINGWTLTYVFPNGQTITQMWGGSYTQSGANVTVTNVSYTATLGANGGSQTLGFLANWTTANNKPAAFTLNGTACTVA